MSLTPGTRLGPYEILGLAGAGGMGEVYRAKDTRLARTVAVKILPAELGSDPDRRQRFEREARVVASLSHPHICALHDVGHQDGLEYLVMEFLEGETLAARLARGGSRSSSAARQTESTPSPSGRSGPAKPGTRVIAGRPLPSQETLRIGRQLAEALGAAHRSGIVHRDLKPANIMLTPSGVKVLDFGLARLHGVEAVAAAPLSTITSPVTSAGVLLGTLPYMAPEQVEGREVDARADIFAFGAILFEMATGRRAFSADSQAGLIASLLDYDPPPISSLTPMAPAALERLVQRCLAKNPEERWQSAHDLATELRWMEESDAGVGARSALRTTRARWTRLVAAAGLGAVALAGGLFIGRSTASRGPIVNPVVVRASIKLPDGVQLSGAGSPVLALSPDGATLAFIGFSDNMTRLYVQRLADGRAKLVPDSEEVEGPFFSPDGEWVAFAVGASTSTGRKAELRKYSLATGLTQTICDIADFFGGTWREDGNIFFYGANAGGMMKVAATGGRAETAVATFKVAGQPIAQFAYFPQALPGNALLVAAEAPNGDNQPSILDLGTGEVTYLGEYGLYSRYLNSGHIVYLRRDGTLMAVPYDPVRRTRTGPTVAVFQDVSITGSSQGAMAFSDNGTFVYTQGPIRGSSRDLSSLVRVSAGKVTPIDLEPDYFVGNMRLAPDGRHLAVTTWGGTLWIYDLARNTRSKLPDEGVEYRRWPVWTPDGSRIAFISAAKGFNIFWQRPDGVSPPEPVLKGLPERNIGTFTSDGSALLFTQLSQEHGIWRLPLDGSGKPVRLITAAGAQGWPALSPDGRWLLYASSESGRFEIYLQPYPALARKVQVSQNGGNVPQWSRDGKTILYRSGQRLLSAQIHPSTGAVGAPRVEHDAADLRGYEATVEGGFIAYQRLPNTGIHRDVELVLNWFEELKRIAPAGR
jgi:serine/threonine-protein kinase